MKNIQKIAAVLIILITTNAFGQKLKAYFDYSVFNHPAEGPYIETYLSIPSYSVEFKATDENKLYSEIEITILFKNEGEEKVKTFKKFVLKSPQFEDSSKVSPKLIDVQSFLLANGKYDMEVILKDLNSTDKEISFNQLIEINNPEQLLSISDILLIESASKADKVDKYTHSGYKLTPYVSNFYAEETDKIGFYAEIYNSDKIVGENSQYLVNYFIENYENQQLVGKYRGFARQTSAAVNASLNFFNIESLPSGNYNLVIEVRNKNNELLAIKKAFFQRSNPGYYSSFNETAYQNTFVDKINTIDSLKECIKSLKPISTELEISFAQNQLKGNDTTLLKQYLLNFWVTRSPDYPEQAWNEYHKKVAEVNKYFSTSIRKGYETDRGRIYLKYDPPNSINRRDNEPSAYPYEIWHYYTIGEYTNRRFVFYSRDMITNDYELLHSDMFGEVNNPNWKKQLHGRSTFVNDPDFNDFEKHHGSQLEELYTLPR
jgi:GWxTD domain-containing protein